MNKRYRTGLSLLEILLTFALMGILILPTIDVMSSMVISQAAFNNDVSAKQTKLSSTERIATSIREGSYIYSEYTQLTVPTSSSSTSVTIGDKAVAVLVPQFESDGDVKQPSIGITSFKGVAFSLIPKGTWESSTSEQTQTQQQYDTGAEEYVLVETTYDIDLAVDTDDPLLISGTIPTDWSNGDSYLLGTNFKPATFTVMSTKTFKIDGDIITFGFVPTAEATYFSSYGSSKIVDDTPYITSVVIRNLTGN
ncbi:MAG: hypothetical protein V2B14_05620 [bacterium]